MLPIISVVGRKNSGKTTLVEGLVRELSRRGYRVGTIKHDAHEFEIDHEGKDSWRHRQAGAQTVVISSSRQVAMVKSVAEDPGIYALVETLLDGVDVVIAEGYREMAAQRVEVVRKEVSEHPLCADHEVIAFVTDTAWGASAPCFGLHEVRSVVDMLERRFLSSAPRLSVSPTETESEA